MADAHKNFAYSTVTVAPSPATTGTTLTVSDGSLFPVAPFNASVWPTAVQPTYTGVTATTAEIVRVTSKGSGNDWTIVRLTEDPTQTARTIVVGDQIAAAITAKTLTDIENNYGNTWSPYELQTGSGVQTLNANSGSVGTGSLFLFPVTLQAPVKFNQILIGNSLSYVLSAVTNTFNNSYYSHFGIYCLTSNTLFTLISSNSFSIAETLSQNGATNASVAWNYPTTTHTSGYGYGTFPAAIDATAKIVSYISASRVVGLHFNAEVSLSGGQHWIGIMSMRSSAVSSVVGLSQVGIIGQVINPMNFAGTVSGLKPIGMPTAHVANLVTSNTGWFGRHIMGIASATTVPNFLGTHVPDNISLSQIGGFAASMTATILPTVTFVST